MGCTGLCAVRGKGRNQRHNGGGGRGQRGQRGDWGDGGCGGCVTAGLLLRLFPCVVAGALRCVSVCAAIPGVTLRAVSGCAAAALGAEHHAGHSRVLAGLCAPHLSPCWARSWALQQAALCIPGADVRTCFSPCASLLVQLPAPPFSARLPAVLGRWFCAGFGCAELGGRKSTRCPSQPGAAAGRCCRSSVRGWGAAGAAASPSQLRELLSQAAN